jgi:hypothetical protein
MRGQRNNILYGARSDTARPSPLAKQKERQLALLEVSRKTILWHAMASSAGYLGAQRQYRTTAFSEGNIYELLHGRTTYARRSFPNSPDSLHQETVDALWEELDRISEDTYQTTFLKLTKINQQASVAETAEVSLRKVKDQADDAWERLSK